MDYSNDVIARYLAYRVVQYLIDNNVGMTYEKAITSTKTTKEAIDYWLVILKEKAGIKITSIDNKIGDVIQ